MIRLAEENLPLHGGCVLTIGNFDGVHLGHRALIAETARIGKEMGLPALVFTFKEHPQSFMGNSLKYVFGPEDKAACMAACGADIYYRADFLKHKDLTPAQFVKRVIRDALGARWVVCGYDFSFGKGGSGTADTLRVLLAEEGIGCTVMPPVTVDGAAVSSTRLRALISEGNMPEAARLLGRPYGFTLPVVSGRRLGAKLGSPTVNQLFPTDRAVPAYGVYAVFCRVEGRIYGGVANIGVKPTVGKEPAPLCETHIFYFSGDLYGKDVKIYLMERLREERQFDSLDALKAQITKDSAAARAILEGDGYQRLKGELSLC